MSRRLNVGCGDRPREGWINLDCQQRPGVDVVHDARQGLPFPDNSFDELLADNFLEHFVSEHVVLLINEFHRVLAPNGRCEIIVPHALSQGAYQDPTHKSFFVPRSAIYWSQTRSKYGGRFVGITADFHEEKLEVYGDPKTEQFIRFVLRAKK